MRCPEVEEFELGFGVRRFRLKRNKQGCMVTKQMSPSMCNTIGEGGQVVVGDEHAIKPALDGTILMQVAPGKRSANGGHFKEGCSVNEVIEVLCRRQVKGAGALLFRAVAEAVEVPRDHPGEGGLKLEQVLLEFPPQSQIIASIDHRDSKIRIIEGRGGLKKDELL